MSDKWYEWGKLDAMNQLAPNYSQLPDSSGPESDEYDAGYLAGLEEMESSLCAQF